MTAAAVAVSMMIVQAPDALAQDFQVWNEAGVKKRINKEFRVAAGAHLRFDDRLSRVKAVMPEVGLTYRFRRWLRFGAGYRFQHIQSLEPGEAEATVSTDAFESRHRLHGQTVVRYRITKQLRLQYRLRYQESVRSGGNRHDVRNRIGIGWARSDLGIYSALETFHRIGTGSGFRKLRFTVGVDYDFGDYDVDLFYRVEEQNTAFPLTVHIVGLGFYYSL